MDRRVDEAIPAGVVAEDSAGADEEIGAQAADRAATDEGAAPSEPVTLASGEFRSLEHPTTGVARILELEDRSRFLRLEELETSNGPDLRVILTDRPVSGLARVGRREVVDLGPLKGNIGSSNYEIPPSLDFGDFETAVIWCRRFSVGFGVVALETPPA